MLRYIIKGGNKLEGEVKISGSKNASLPIIAATILNSGKSTLYNVPNIHDTQMMFEILKKLGGKIEKKNNKIIIDTSKINKFEIPEDLMRQMRSSVILVGGLLGKHRKATFSYPGGCDIGARPIDLHLKSFEKLGINITKNYGNISCICDKIEGEKIDLDFPSVGATENIMLASVLAVGTTVINNAAREPEIVDLQKFLNKMGAKIKGAGSNKIEIQGVRNLKDVSYNIMPDRIEAGTFLCATAITSGNTKLVDLNSEHITPVITKLEEAGCKLKVDKKTIEIIGPKRLKAIDLKTMPYPGFPTDMQSIMATTLTVAKGTSVIVENIFENRFKYMQELNRMGAKISTEGKTAVIKGVRKLYGANVKATDLRGGASMVIAGLVAKEITTVENIEYILRGYENFENKLFKLNANIRKEEI
ncbi:MAG: UDP-N-acetylglucosamine 1-carboxyvinyltransferase [Clostridia bacterium]|nr:UDP-N-acetylglucosamine 1-carboxyvinyltransferase [Clostridia bacterium]